MIEQNKVLCPISSSAMFSNPEAGFIARIGTEAAVVAYATLLAAMWVAYSGVSATKWLIESCTRVHTQH